MTFDKPGGCAAWLRCRSIRLPQRKPPCDRYPCPDGFQITANNGPAVTMKATGKRSSDGSRAEFTATCPIDMDGAGIHYISPQVTAELSRSGKAAVSWEIRDLDESVMYECH